MNAHGYVHLLIIKMYTHIAGNNTLEETTSFDNWSIISHKQTQDLLILDVQSAINKECGHLSHPTSNLWTVQFGACRQGRYRTRRTRFAEEELKHRIRDCWKETLFLNNVTKSITVWKKRLRIGHQSKRGTN